MNRTIDLRQLRYFLAVADECSFRRAAERLHITQPPLSRQVAELEQALGVPLLVRSTRRVQLTAAGELAQREFGRLLAAVEAAVARVAGQAAAAPLLRLGVLYWIDLQALPAIERRLRAAGAAAGLAPSTMTSHESIKALRRGALDAALVVHPIDARGLDVAVVGALRLAAYVPAASKLARRRVVSLPELVEVSPFHRFRRSFNPPLHDFLLRQYEAHGFRPRQVVPALEAMGVLAQIGAGRGCTCMPEALARHRARGVAVRRLREDVFIELALVTPPRLDPMLREALCSSVRRLLPAPAMKRRAPPARS